MIVQIPKLNKMLLLLALTFLIMKLQVGAAKSFSPDGRQYLFLKRVPETNFVRNYILHTNGKLYIILSMLSHVHIL